MNHLIAVLILMTSALGQVPLGGITVSPSGGGGVRTFSTVGSPSAVARSAATTSLAVPFGQTTGSNHPIVAVWVSSWATNTIGVTGTGASCTFLQGVFVRNTTDNGYDGAWIFYCYDAPAGMTGVTVSNSGNDTIVAFARIYLPSSQITSDPIDGSVCMSTGFGGFSNPHSLTTASGGQSPCTGGTLTIAGTNDLLLGIGSEYYNQSGTYAAGSGWTAITQDNGGIYNIFGEEQLNVASGNAATMTYSGASNGDRYGAGVVALKGN